MNLSVNQLAEIAAKVFTKASVSVSGNSVSVIYKCGCNEGFDQSFERKDGTDEGKLSQPLEPIEFLVEESWEVSLLLSYKEAGARAVLTFKFDEKYEPAGNNPILVSINDSETKHLTEGEIRQIEESIEPSREPYHFSKDFRLAVATGNLSDEQRQDELKKIFDWIDGGATPLHVVDFTNINKWNRLKNLIGGFSDQWDLDFFEPRKTNSSAGGFADMFRSASVGEPTLYRFLGEKKDRLLEMLRISDGMLIEGTGNGGSYFTLSFCIDNIYTE